MDESGKLRQLATTFCKILEMKLRLGFVYYHSWVVDMWTSELGVKAWVEAESRLRENRCPEFLGVDVRVLEGVSGLHYYHHHHH